MQIFGLKYVSDASNKLYVLFSSISRGLLAAVPGLKRNHADSLVKFYRAKSLESERTSYSSRRHSPERLMLDFRGSSRLQFKRVRRRKNTTLRLETLLPISKKNMVMIAVFHARSRNWMAPGIDTFVMKCTMQCAVERESG